MKICLLYFLDEKSEGRILRQCSYSYRQVFCFSLPGGYFLYTKNCLIIGAVLFKCGMLWCLK